jgi:hypothetical protein
MASWTTMATTFATVNTEWMEALDVGSGRFYFINLNSNETSWECPPGFLIRKDLVAAHAKLIGSGAGANSGCMTAPIDDIAFLARVRERFPPPVTPQSGGGDDVNELKKLKAKVVEMDAQKADLQAALTAATSEKALLEQILETLSAGPSMGAAPPSCVAPPMLSAAEAMLPTWKRGASQRFAGVEMPPAPPPWAICQSKSGIPTVVSSSGPQLDTSRADALRAARLEQRNSVPE